jgi:hypothetical protein
MGLIVNTLFVKVIRIYLGRGKQKDGNGTLFTSKNKTQKQYKIIKYKKYIKLV